MKRRRSKSQNQSYSKTKSKEEDKSQTSTKEVSDKSREQEAPKEETRGNDPAWYARDPYLARDAGSYYFSYAFGKNYKIRFSTNHTVNGTSNADGDTAVPGIITLKMKPTLGFNDTATSPLTVAANSFYGFIRSKNSGRKNYDPPDLLQFLVAIANIDSAIVWAMRLYATALTFADQNRFIGDALISAQGVDPGNFRYNLANFRMKLNAFINKMAVYAVPSDVTYFNKAAFMFQNVYLENGEGNIKDQMYLYIPDGFYRYTRDADSMTMLDYAVWEHGSAGQTLASWTDVLNYLDFLATDVFGDEDVSLMSGDIYKVYGDAIIRLASIDENVALPLVYDPMVLWQMKNTYYIIPMRRGNNEAASTATGNRAKTGNSEYTLGSGRTQSGRPGCVFQTTNGVLVSVERSIDSSAVSSTTYAAGNPNSYYIAMDKLLCSDLPAPDIGVVLESSRNIISYHDAPHGYTGTESNKNLGWIQCGTYLCVELTAWDLNTNNQPHSTKVLQYHGWSSTARQNEAMFKYIPTIFKIDLDSNGNVTNANPCTDINNFVILDQNSITKLHEVALLSLLYVPGIAKLG